MSTKHDPKTVTVYCYCLECQNEHHKIMELPTKQNKRIEEAAQKIQDLYFDNGATVNVETWEKTLALLPSLICSIIEEIIAEIPDQDDLPPQTEAHKHFKQGADWALMHTHAMLKRKMQDFTH